MGCCDFKEKTGKCMVFLSTIVFNIGVITAVCAPQWITFTALSDSNSLNTSEVQYGPFYSQSRTCVSQSGACSKWSTQSIDLSDCDAVGDDLSKLCGQLNTWRIFAIICLILVLSGGAIVFAGACCQMITCGCCGSSLDCIANMMFWAEVLLSIVVWSFAISSLSLIKDAPQVTDTGYLWAFWVFIVFGTVVGAMAATFADWAAESSCLRGICKCLTCRKDDD